MFKLFSGLVASLLLSFTLVAEAALADQTIYLVRHAEKAKDGTRDPALTKDGEKRALWLATYFKDKGLEAIYSSDYTRTRDTAAPTAKLTGLKVELYDARDLQEIADRAKAHGGTVLISGHSNTTNVVTNLLAGTGFEELDEKEYRLIFVVTLKDDGSAVVHIDHSNTH